MNDFAVRNFIKFIASSGKEEWRDLPHISYQPNEILGKTYEGSTIYRGRFGHRQVAIKEVDADSNFNIMEQEVELIISWEGHPNVIKYFAKEKCGGFYYLALDLCQGNLKEYTLSEKFFYGEPLEPMALLQQITQGLHYLHENKRIHGRLHHGNILISQPDDFNKVKAVITDFSLNNSDTPGKRLSTQEYTEAGDVFSLGCLHNYVITKGCNQDSMYRQPENVKLEGENAFIKDFIQLMVHKNPKARPTCVEILQSPLYWSSAQTLQYLETVADWLVSGILHEKVLRQMEDGRNTIFQDNWKDVLTPGLQILLNGEFKHDQKYDYKSVVELLRMIRNKSRHYNDVPDNVKQEFTSHPDGYVKYFTSRFPQLVLHVFNIFRAFTENANLVLRNHKTCECRQQMHAGDETYCKIAENKEHVAEKHVQGANNLTSASCLSYEKYAEGSGMALNTDIENESGDQKDEKKVPNIRERIKQFEFAKKSANDQSKITRHFPQPDSMKNYDRDLLSFVQDSVNATESYVESSGHGNLNMDISLSISNPEYAHLQMSDNDQMFLEYSRTACATETRNENVCWTSTLDVTPIFNDKRSVHEHKQYQNLSKRFPFDKHPESKPKMEYDMKGNDSADLYPSVPEDIEDSSFSDDSEDSSFSDVKEDPPVPDVNEDEDPPVPDVNEDPPVPDVNEDEDPPVPDVNEDEDPPVPDVNEDDDAPVPDVDEDPPVPDVNEDEDPPVPDVNEDEDPPVPDVNEDEDPPVPDVNEDDDAPVPDVDEDPPVPDTFSDETVADACNYEPGAVLSNFAPVPGFPQHAPKRRAAQFAPKVNIQEVLCHLCNKAAHVVESLVINGKRIHKTCFRCSKCKAALKMGKYGSDCGVLYCSQHFQQLVIAKGNHINFRSE